MKTRSSSQVERFLADVCHLRSRHHRQFVHVSEPNFFPPNCPRSIFSHCIRSKQYRKAEKLTAGVIISPRRNIYPGGALEKSSKKFLEKFSQCRK